MKTITQVFKETKVELEEQGIDTPVLDARLLVQHALNMTHEDILMNSKKIVTEDQMELLRRLTARRKNREPVSRIVGHRTFWKSDFKISPDTLDPRQDSETVIEAALRYVTEKPARVLDLGTGSGCLILSLLQEWPMARGVGVDISAGAVAVAQENAQNLKLDDRCEFKAMSWEDYKPDELFDVVVSNPPYIAQHEMKDLEPEVTNFDPVTALVAGEDGLEAYRSLIAHMRNWVKKDGFILFEIGYQQARSVKDLLAVGGFAVLHTVADLGGHPRVVVAKNSPI